MSKKIPSSLSSAQRKVTMKKFSMAVGAALALAGVTAPAQAQNLNWYGMNGCFSSVTMASGALHSNSNTVANGNCGDAATSQFNFDAADYTTSSSWWGTQVNDETSYLRFTRNASVAGPTNNTSADPLSVTFSGVNQSRYVNLGRLRFYDDRGNQLDYAFLNFSMFFGTGSIPSVTYNEKFKLDFTDVSGGEKFSFNNPTATLFSVGGYDYEFSVGGLEYDPYDCTSPDLSLPYNHYGSLDKDVCGKIKYLGESSPNIQTTVPEPSTYALMGAGLMGIFGFARRRNRNA